MSGSQDAQALAEWVAAVGRELGLGDGVEDGSIVDMVLDLTADVAHGVSRPGAPVTAFLVGLAAGRAADPVAAAREHAATVSRLAAGWPDTRG
ncbi:DUF6457 domain-containing protein [Pseudonocardia sp. GCM10023141]|uniref:DUF6457 domain-containing protein n=1 Tax=Pseudonocardia sp. GCM10023141 TaxID=3252653 RepID=UPI0036069B42